LENKNISSTTAKIYDAKKLEKEAAEAERQLQKDLKKEAAIRQEALDNHSKQLVDTGRKVLTETKNQQTLRQAIIKNGEDSIQAVEATARKARLDAELAFKEKLSAISSKLESATYNPNLAKANADRASEAAKKALENN